MRAGPALLLALSASTLTGGCTALAVGAAAGATVLVAKDRTLGEGIDETTGGAEVRAKLLAADFGTFSRISVEMAQGRLLLAGSVPTLEHKIEAERIAWTVAPVRMVENNLDVGPRPDLWRGSWDAWITTEIRTRFLAEDLIKSLNFNVETHRGTVYLMGVARNENMLERAVDIARHVGGVEKVISYIEVRARDPEQRAAQFSAARATSPSTPAPAYDQRWPGPAAEPEEFEQAAPYAPRPASNVQSPPSGRRLEVRYPDEDRTRGVEEAPPMVEELPPGVQRASRGARETTGISGFGRDWSTPRQAGAGGRLQPTAQPVRERDADDDRSSGAPLQVSRR